MHFSNKDTNHFNDKSSTKDEGKPEARGRANDKTSETMKSGEYQEFQLHLFIYKKRIRNIELSVGISGRTRLQRGWPTRASQMTLRKGYALAFLLLFGGWCVVRGSDIGILKKRVCVILGLVQF